MRTTQLQRRGSPATPKDLDLLQGTDLGRPSPERTGRRPSDIHGEFGPYPLRAPVRHHRTGKRSGKILAAVIALLTIAAAVIATLVLAPGESVIEPEPGAAIEAPLTLRELGRDPGPTPRPSETDVIVLDVYGLVEAPTIPAVPKVQPGEMLPA
jgi:hypothetical protein